MFNRLAEGDVKTMLISENVTIVHQHFYYQVAKALLILTSNNVKRQQLLKPILPFYYHLSLIKQLSLDNLTHYVVNASSTYLTD